MWRLIRGCGLSYGYAIHMSQNEGRLIFSLYRASNAVQAYCKAKSILVCAHKYKFFFKYFKGKFYHKKVYEDIEEVKYGSRFHCVSYLLVLLLGNVNFYLTFVSTG